MICTLLALYHYIAEKMAGNQERTYIMIKPDGVQRGLVGEIIKRFEVKGFKLVALKFLWVSEPIFFVFFPRLQLSIEYTFPVCTRSANIRTRPM